MTTRWRVVVEYDGAPFVGWARQPNGPSVQAALEEALVALLQESVRVEGAGRTDAGVHALGQVAAFTTTAVRSADAVRDGLNALLPESVACVQAEEVALGFDPRRHARSKLYRYGWWVRRARSPLNRSRCWHLGKPLDLPAMQAAGEALLGTHDFTSFRAAGCGAAHAVRTVDVLRLHGGPDQVLLDVEGPSFLRHMVRIIAGTLTEVGLGRRPPTWIGEVLRSADRRLAGRTAPAHGLTLVEVRYEAD